MKRKRTVPVTKVGDSVVGTELVVETDSSGHYWLTPDQIRQLKEMRQAFDYLRAGNQLLPGAHLIRKSRRTSRVKAAIPQMSASTVAAFAGLMRRTWLRV